jgi:hypothetical protein
MDVRCDKCSAPAEVVLRVLGEQLPASRPRIDLCRRCHAALERWLAPPTRPAGRAEVLDDDQGDELEGD